MEKPNQTQQQTILANEAKNPLSIKEWSEKIHENAKNHGWWNRDERSFGELLMLCVSELAEAFEEFRNGREIKETYYTKDAQENDKMEGIPSEIADVVIRIMDLCEYFGIDLEKAIAEKHAYNVSRPYRHGNKKC